MTTFEQTLRLAGLMPRDVVADGRWRRCATEDHPKKKNGAYKLALDGRRGWFRNWADGRGVQSWEDGQGEYKQSPIDEERQRRHRERERQERVQGIGWARKLWAESKTYRPHKYLTDKGLSAEGCHLLRIWTGAVWVDEGQRVQDTWLIVPLYWRDRLVNVQRISGAGIKRQMKAAPQKACSLILNRPRAALTVIAEGLATGLAVYQSMRNARVVVCFFVDNLLPVVQELKPAGSVVIAADNDFKTAARGKGNPGREKALNVADLIGCGVAWPEGVEGGHSGADWADALKEWGQAGPRRIERLIQAQARYVAATG